MIIQILSTVYATDDERLVILVCQLLNVVSCNIGVFVFKRWKEIVKLEKCKQLANCLGRYQKRVVLSPIRKDIVVFLILKCAGNVLNTELSC